MKSITLIRNSLHFLLIIRFALPVFAFALIATSPHIETVGIGLVLLIASYCAHRVLRSHFPIFTMDAGNVLQINTVEEFIPFPRWLIPFSEFDIDTEDYKVIESDISEQSSLVLKDIAKNKGAVTYYDLVNALLLDMKLYARINSESRKNNTIDSFIDKK